MTGDKPQDVVGEMWKVDRSRKTGELSKRILSSINQSFSGSEATMNWLKNVNEQVPIGAQGGQTNVPTSSLTMIGLVDKLFDDFQRYAFQFNQTEPDTSLFITCKRPGEVSRSTGFYEGFLQNSTWAMVIRGQPMSIQAIFVSPRFLYEDESKRPVSRPFLEITAGGDPGKLIWKSNGQVIPAQHLPVLSKSIFARFIRVSRREVNETDQLTLGFTEQSQKGKGQPDGTAYQRDDEVEAITNALITILETVDTLLPELQKQGFEAMQKGGMDALQIVMKQSDYMQSLRQKIAVIAKDWSDFVREC